MSDYVSWLRGLAELGGKGVVHNIDARCLGRIADELERLNAEKLELANHIDGCVRVAADALKRAEVAEAVCRLTRPDVSRVVTTERNDG